MVNLIWEWPLTTRARMVLTALVEKAQRWTQDVPNFQPMASDYGWVYMRGPNWDPMPAHVWLLPDFPPSSFRTTPTWVAGVLSWVTFALAFTLTWPEAHDSKTMEKGCWSEKEKRREEEKTRKIQRRGSQWPGIRAGSTNTNCMSSTKVGTRNKKQPLAFVVEKIHHEKFSLPQWTVYENKRASHLESISPKEHNK